VPGIVALFYISVLDEAGSCELALPPPEAKQTSLVPQQAAVSSRGLSTDYGFNLVYSIATAPLAT
jgi:hypothetical protein